MSFSLLGIFAGVGIVTGIATSILTGLGKTELAKITTMSAEAIMWGGLLTIYAALFVQAAGFLDLGGTLHSGDQYLPNLRKMIDSLPKGDPLRHLVDRIAR